MNDEVIITDEILKRDFNIDVMSVVQNSNESVMIRLFGDDTHRDILIDKNNKIISIGSYFGSSSKLGIKLKLLKDKKEQDTKRDKNK